MHVTALRRRRAWTEFQRPLSWPGRIYRYDRATAQYKGNQSCGRGRWGSRLRYSYMAGPDQMPAVFRTGTYGELWSAGGKDAHHVIQDAAVRELVGYSRSEAPAVQLPGPSTRPETPHYKATRVQREPGGGTYAAERRIGYKALRKAGLSRAEPRRALRRADAYF